MKERNVETKSWADRRVSPQALHPAVFLLLLFFSCIAFTVDARAQTSYGSVVGLVTDPTGAVIPGASVVLRNSATNASQTVVTGAGGNYSFVNLNPSMYDVTVTKEGFDSLTQSGVNVHVSGVVRLDVTLKLGTQSQTVVVSATQSEMQTESSSLGGVVQGEQVVEAPLNGRNVNNLLDFVPGVVPGGGTQGSTMSNQSDGQTQAIAYNNYQIGGGFSGQSIFFIDGMEQNIAENNVDPLVPTQDVVQEFRVSTSDVSPEFDGYGGGVVQIVTKSGTNKLRGNAYEYVRNTDLDANDWFSNHYGLGKTPLHQNQYGANLGGPILRNKAFFFFSWEHESLLSSSPSSETVPTTNELAGDFSSDPTIIYCPAVGSYGCTPGQPLPGNQLTYIDPTALSIAKLETPGETRVTQSPYTTNFKAAAPYEGYQTQFNVRGDMTPDEKDSLFVRYTYWNPHNGPSDPTGTKTGLGPTGNYTQEGEIGDSHTFSASTLVDIHLSYLENYNFQNILSDGYDMSSLGSAYGTIQGASENNRGILPALSIQGYGIGAAQSTLYWNNNVWGINGGLTKILGHHTIKVGAEWRQMLWEAYGYWTYGLNATPFFTASSAADTTTGNALASFLMGIPSSTVASYGGTEHAYLHNYALYVMDTYQPTKKLTLTAGLRWTQPGAFSEEHNLDSVLQPNASVTIGTVSSYTNPVSGSTVPLTGGTALLASSQYSGTRDELLHWHLFSPRAGLSYEITPQTVFRLGYGISYLPPDLAQEGPQLNPINRANTNYTNQWGQPLVATVDNPLPSGFVLPGGHTQAALDALLGSGVWAGLPQVPYGYAQQWNVAVQRALGANSSLTAAYAGAKGTHLVIASAYTGPGYNLNQLPDQYDSLGTNLLTQVANPFYGALPSTSVVGGQTVAEGYLLEPHPQYPDGMLQYNPRYGASTYNALQMQYNLRMAHGNLLQAAYTFSKLLSNTDNTSSFLDNQGAEGITQDNYNLKAEKSLSMQDITNNLVIDYGFSLPFGHGQRYLANLSGAANSVLGGWRVNGITIFRSGVPIALTAPANVLSQFGGGTAPFGPGQSGVIRPDYTTGCSKAGSGSAHSAQRANEWFNTSCFAQSDAYSFGNESRVDPSIRSDKQANFDTVFSKSFSLPREASFKFSGEIFNLFNHPQFGLPGSEVGISGFGQVSKQANIPRTAQFEARITF
jgi:outer membrane receptor protein involved in Fe transport